jgi:TonB family protein
MLIHRLSHERGRSTAGFHSAAAFLALLSTAAIAQTSAQNPDGSAPGEQIQTEVLVEPEFVKKPAVSAVGDGEGWVELGLMVDPAGKPFEVTVIASSGNKLLDQQVVASMERATYKPALLNGQPVESATTFDLARSRSDVLGPRRDFIYAYKDLQKAIEAKDRPKADAAMKLLEIQNLYEDAYFGLATYAYAREWGDETQQLAGLDRATAHDFQSIYLPREQSRTVKLATLLLDVHLRHYSEAMDLWPIVLKSGIDAATIEKLTPIMHQVDQVRVLHQSYDLSGSMPEGSWHIGLYEGNFRIVVGHGHISQVKLRCSKGFVRFAFDPEIEYKVAHKDGNCDMEVDGDPGTAFTLTQF